jgi:hypothetical protein
VIDREEFHKDVVDGCAEDNADRVHDVCFDEHVEVVGDFCVKYNPTRKEEKKEG